MTRTQIAHGILTAALAAAVVILWFRLDEATAPKAEPTVGIVQEVEELQRQVESNARAIGELTEAVGSLAETTQQIQAKIDAAKDAIDELTREAL